MPRDSFALDLDGVNLLASARDESLEKVVPDLLEAVYGLAIDGEHFSQVSMPEAHLELCLWRVGAEVEIAVVSLARPARLLRPAIRVDLLELVEASVLCGRSMLQALSETRPQLLSLLRIRQIPRWLNVLESGRLTALRSPLAAKTFQSSSPPKEGLAFGYEFSDSGRLVGFGRKGLGPLTSLLIKGAVHLTLSRKVIWSAEAVPFLAALELARQASELSHGAEMGDPRYGFQPAGLGPPLNVNLRSGEISGLSETIQSAPLALAGAMYELGLEWSVAVTSHHRPQARNPYIAELVARCQEGLGHLRGAVRAPEPGLVAKGAREVPSGGKPIASAGPIRRLRFEPLWEKDNLGEGGAGHLLLSPRGPVFASLGMACAFSAQGRLLFRRLATHGVATSPTGQVICATADRLSGFSKDESGARWVRDHDGLVIGPDLLSRSGLLLCLSDSRTALAFSELTGREMWRISPQRTQRCFLSVQGHRAMLATDSGYLYGVDLTTGQIRYRLRAILPFKEAVVPWGARAVGALGAENLAVFVADANSGEIAWVHETTYRPASIPLPARRRVFVVAEQEEDGVLVCLNAAGKLEWERRLHLGRGPYSLLSYRRSTLACCPSGGAAMVGGDGRIEWRIGPAGEPLARLISPALVRNVLLLPGEKVRALDPVGGRLLAEIPASGLVDMQVDPRLNLFLLSETGVLSAHRLATHLAVVPQLPDG